MLEVHEALKVNLADHKNEHHYGLQYLTSDWLEYVSMISKIIWRFNYILCVIHLLLIRN